MATPSKKICRQNAVTWSRLHQRISAIPFDLSNAIDASVFTFLDNKAKSMGSCVGYLMPAILTTVCYLMSTKNVKVRLTEVFSQAVNLYTILVGPPSTAKSPAMKEGVTAPLEEVLGNAAKTVVSNTTSSGLTKLLSKEGQCFVCSPEIFDVLNKLLKSDEDNATGDIQLLCKLFTGEKCTYHYSTENVREIGPYTPFGLLGATQVSNAARLLGRMDSGHGLVDRILMAIPPAFRPLPEEEAECRQRLMESNFNCISSIYRQVINLHEDDTTYYFEDEAEQAIKAINYEHIMQINEALKNGECTPQSKKSDLIPRVAVGIHVLEHVTVTLLNGDQVQPIPQGIQEPTVKKAIDYVNYLESQKEVFLAVSTFSLVDDVQKSNAMLKGQFPVSGISRAGKILYNNRLLRRNYLFSF